MSPKEIQDFFIPIVKLAEHLLKIHEAKMQETKKQEINKPPVVTVSDVIKVAYIHMFTMQLMLMIILAIVNNDVRIIIYR